jgi:RHH-type proline utilization regulon transcriptional repressor/proline dehydrogenase/delta 1-pyrroline-5-carboxylate dehydrogenase
VPPTLIELAELRELKHEVFGPVLHVLRYRRGELDRLLDDINATGYGLTFGVHTRLDETVARATGRSHAGNIYVNRNLIGAVVGVQPFGGQGLSGTGPKAGGPLYMRRLLSRRPVSPPIHGATECDAGQPLTDWCALLRAHGQAALAERCLRIGGPRLAGMSMELPGPLGESNTYSLLPRGTVLCMASSLTGLYVQVGTVLAAGDKAAIVPFGEMPPFISQPPDALHAWISTVENWRSAHFDAVLFEGDADALRAVTQAVAALGGPLRAVQGLTTSDLADERENYALEMLLAERSVSINTAAVGGNAGLMSVG